jgi:hypothetical protein
MLDFIYDYVKISWNFIKIDLLTDRSKRKYFKYNPDRLMMKRLWDQTKVKASTNFFN